jgi:hypothetical protein
MSRGGALSRVKLNGPSEGYGIRSAVTPDAERSSVDK